MYGGNKDFKFFAYTKLILSFYVLTKVKPFGPPKIHTLARGHEET